MRAGLPAADRPWIKVCGVRSEADLEACASAGATHVGLNLWPVSPRQVAPPVARRLVACARRLGLSPVVVYVPGSALSLRDASDLRPDYVQSRVKPDPASASELSAAGVEIIESRPASAGALTAAPWGRVLLLDTPAEGAEGGTGTTFDWALASAAPRPFILAGGLGPLNVAEAIASARPAGVDAASRLESSPGVKDPERIRAFCRAARAAFEEIHHAL